MIRNHTESKIQIIFGIVVLVFFVLLAAYHVLDAKPYHILGPCHTACLLVGLGVLFRYPLLNSIEKGVSEKHTKTDQEAGCMAGPENMIRFCVQHVIGCQQDKEHQNHDTKNNLNFTFSMISYHCIQFCNLVIFVEVNSCVELLPMGN